MKIVTQLKIIVLVLFFFGIIGNVVIYHQVSDMTMDGRVVNYSGIVRGMTQRFIKLEVSGKKADDLRQKLDKIVNGLINGDIELNLPPATDVNYLAMMNQVSQSWEGLKQGVMKARQNPEAKEELIKLSENYFDLTNKMVSAAEEYSKVKVDGLKMVQLVIFMINLVLLLLIWMLAQKKITAPLTYLTEKVQKVVSGDFGVVIDYNSNDEIGTLAQNMNKMVQSFKVCIKKLYPDAYKD
ncbi:MAG: HAMP domain-containing protein [Dissulfurispiraceae bacterium]|jgi:methyl-accepting chemotaxis protein|nr:HAMP domain-containing protein [Dissulfurispiraceae bacterium]